MKQYNIIILLATAILVSLLAQQIQSQNSSSNFTQADYDTFFLGLENYHGFISLDSNASLFYWLFPVLNQSDDAPLIVWIDGGPGTSDELGVFYQNGPYRINSSNSSQYTLYQNPYTWVNVANVLYLDQPRGTGFSISQNTHETQVADDFYNFFTQFLELYPQFKGRELMISGWSYGGQMVPEIAAKLKQESFNNSDINLQYVAIGNGWISSYYNFGSQPEYAYKNQLINESLYNDLQQKVSICQYLIDQANANRTNLNNYYMAMGYCETKIWYPIIAKTVPTNYAYFVDDPNFNAWYIREPCIGPPNCGFDVMSNNLTILINSSKLVQQYLGVENIYEYWTFWNQTVQEALTKYSVLDQQQEKINYLLNNSVNVLMYEGVYDFVCNWIGSLQALESMQWEGASTFQNQTFQPFVIQDNQYGEFISTQNLAFLKVYNAGHNVIIDQPMVALNMITRFLNGWSSCQTNQLLNGLNECVDCSSVYGPYCETCNQYTCTFCSEGRTYGLSNFQPFYEVCQYSS